MGMLEKAYARNGRFAKKRQKRYIEQQNKSKNNLKGLDIYELSKNYCFISFRT